MDTALVIIDVQYDYFSHGKSELFQAKQALIVTKKLLEHFRTKKLPASFINKVYMASLNGKFAEVMTSADYFAVN